MDYRKVKVNPGEGGWGKGLVIAPTQRRAKVVSVTGGGIHPVAARIAEMTGAEAVDGFRTQVPKEEMCCVVVNCGGTARIGVYPRMGVLTIDVIPSGPSGPLMEYIKETNFVSGVRPDNVVAVDGSAEDSAPAAATAGPASSAVPANPFAAQAGGQKGFFLKLSGLMGYIVGTLYQSGREAVDMIIRNILPFMAFVSLLIGIVLYTGLGHDLATVVAPLGGTVWGLVIVVVIGTFPLFSPMLGPGAVVAQIVGVFVGTEIAAGVIPPQYALPALFAIDGQVGCDFIPVAMALGEATVETTEVGVPAVLFSRQVTGAVAVVLAWLASFGLYAGAR
ncbi:MAG: PTS glucitol/sorbitol transporter subunit IIB [Thermaerobacter sp.]|nr:PTS glucitol/sorbitol transporter subunit IIB [Thermaerobacter sp.]